MGREWTPDRVLDEAPVAFARPEQRTALRTLIRKAIARAVYVERMRCFDLTTATIANDTCATVPRGEIIEATVKILRPGRTRRGR